MNLKLRVYIGDQIKDVSLAKNKKFVTIGSAESDTIKVVGSSIIPNHLVFLFDNQWVCLDNVKRSQKAVDDGDVFVLSMESRIAVAVYSDGIIPQKLVLKSNSKIVIGRAFECMFHLPDRSVGRQHAEVTVDEYGVTLRDLNSVNGTYINSRKISEQTLNSGDIISIGKYNILYKNDTLELCIAQDKPVFDSDDKGVYPTFSLSPRLRHKAPSEIIEIQSPPNLGNMPAYNWLSFIPMLVTQNVYSAVFPLASYFSTYLQKKKYKEAEEVRQEKYERYLAGVKEKIDKNRDDQFLALEESNHETYRCFDIATRRERTLWERAPEDDDFMKVRIGKGNINISFQIKFPDGILKMSNDELESQGEDLGRGNQILEDAPILCDIYNDLSIGIIGNRQKALNVARNMIVQLATTHSYKDLKIVTLFSKKEFDEWKYVKWLPHSFSDSREVRYVANDVFNAVTLEKIIDNELKDRKAVEFEQVNNKKIAKTPFYLFVVSTPELIEESEIENYLDNAVVGAGIGVIYVYNELGDLPKSCNVIIDVSRDRNEVFHKSNVGEKQRFEIDKFSADKADVFARSLAPVRLVEKKSTANMPTCVTFLEGYGVKRVEELSILDNWKTSELYKSMTVPLGVKENGEQFMFNIMYGNDFTRYHGCHGLLAGTNGSGKSEMMQSFILSMATMFSPADVSFIIVDYKGTGMLLPFRNLPHLAGAISNLDGNVRRNIIAIEKEIKRRQVIFDEAGVLDIKDYYRKGFHKTYKPLPIIITIVDEFAEIKKNLPEFIPTIETIFQIGRSLGMWAVVSTQKPSGVVTSNMYANSKFRWCCRVATSADSKEMLHHTDAARIKNAGRAYVQIGEDDIYEQVQSFWSGAPYDPDRTESISLTTPISMVDITGKRIQYEPYNTKKVVSNKKEVDVVVEHICKLAEANRIPFAPKVWQEKLPCKICIDNVAFEKYGEDFAVPYGMIDNPYDQSQYSAVMNFSDGGHHLVYGLPGSGKTTFLHTCIMSVAKNYTSAEANIYALDFGSWTLNWFSELPHMCGVANDNDKDKVEKILRTVSGELDKRKKTFAMSGVSGIKAYNQKVAEKLPHIVVVVDNLSKMLSVYPEFEGYFMNLTREGANFGIYMLATTGANGGVSYKITSNIKCNIALRLKDSGDYTSLLGKTNNMEPDAFDGRGLVRQGSYVLEFQTALPSCGNDDNEMLDNMKAEIAEIAEKYDGINENVIRDMPESVCYSSVDSDKIVLGLSVEDVTPVEWDLEQMPYYAVVSYADSIVCDAVMKNIIRQFYEKEGAEVVYFDNGTEKLSYISDFSGRKIDTVAELDNYIDQLSLELSNRQITKDTGDDDFKPILLVVHGYKEMFEAITNESAARLSVFLRKGRKLKVFLLVSEHMQKMSELCAQEPMMRQIVDEGVGILCGGSFYSHKVFTGNLSYIEAERSLNEQEAYLNVDEVATKFKIASEF